MSVSRLCNQDAANCVRVIGELLKEHEDVAGQLVDSAVTRELGT